MATLKLFSNNAGNPLTLDLSSYLNLQDGSGTDPADPAYTNKVWSRSLLKEGATLSLEQLTERELTFPVLLNATSTTALNTLVEQINQIIESPGATCTWQDDGASQLTTFDMLSGLLEIAYDYRRAQQHWLGANLRLFTQPLGRTPGPRPYASASGVGPLLTISPYASSGALAIGASTQAGVAGYGGQQQGASSGVFYWGSPSLAGDAPAKLQISWVGPLPNQATNAGVVPFAAMSVLPDAQYRPLITAAEFVSAQSTPLVAVKSVAAVASQYVLCGSATPFLVSIMPPASQAEIPPLNWAGQHRLFAIARYASSLVIPAPPAVALSVAPGPNTQGGTASVLPGDWTLYDLGTLSIRPSEMPTTSISLIAEANNGGICDVSALVMLPDNATWYLNPRAINASQYGLPSPLAQPLVYSGFGGAPYSNTLLLDDVLGDQFLYMGASQRFAPSPIGGGASAARITAYTRGLMPRPDPKGGLPILAFLGVGQMSTPTAPFLQVNAASWTDQQNQLQMVQVNVLERSRYVLP
jgi:hypothetical protein